MSLMRKLKIRKGAQVCILLLLVFAGLIVADHFSSVDRYFDLGNGFWCVEHARRLYTAPVRWVAVEYHPTNGSSTVVWPSVIRTWDKAIQISNHAAVLVGYSPQAGSDLSQGRLIGFQAPGGPLTDISEPVLQSWCGKQRVELASISGVSFESVVTSYDA